MDRGQEERPLLVEAWLGSTILVEHLGGQRLEGEDLCGISAEELAADAPQRVKTSLLILENYNQFGIEVRFREAQEPHFLPWGAILMIAGIDQEASENIEEALREREEPEPTEGAGLPRSRQELMDKLGNALTPSEIVDAKAAADDWLATHPSDGDVRMARERLEPRPPDETDLEEGSPT